MALSDLRWLIIGGGIHGTYLSRLLTGEGGVSRDDIRVLDPHDAPLTVWHHQTQNCGMGYLRSPSAHNLDLPVTSILRFARTPEGEPWADFIPPYYRPSLSLFRKHTEHVIREHHLDTLRIRGRATAMEQKGAGIRVHAETETWTARQVILAPGITTGDGPYRPGWAEELRQDGGRISHVFDPGFRREELPDLPETAVIGGGITAVQLALSLCREKSGRITLLSRHPIRENNLDFDPCWIGPKCLREFHRTGVEDRRTLIDNARNRGTVPSETVERFEGALSEGAVGFHQVDDLKVTRQGDRMQLRWNGGELMADQVILATGFDRKRPGGVFVDRIIKTLDLPTASCGFPVLDPFFRWREGIFVSGALAELQGGPCARNIVGARNMGRQLLRFLRKS